MVNKPTRVNEAESAVISLLALSIQYCPAWVHWSAASAAIIQEFKATFTTSIYQIYVYLETAP